MDKQELIDYCNAIKENKGQFINCIDVNRIIKRIEQLDEPQKVKVSEEEAKLLETFNLNHSSDVTKALYYISRVGFGYYLTNNVDLELRGLSEKFWDIENRKRLIRAILDGYEMEKEPKYTVRMKGIVGYPTHLNKKLDNQNWFFASKNEVDGYRVKHTRKELEDAGFGWVFDCEGVEIKEVE